MPKLTKETIKRQWESLLRPVPKEETKKEREKRLKIQRELINKVGYLY